MPVRKSKRPIGHVEQPGMRIEGLGLHRHFTLGLLHHGREAPGAQGHFDMLPAGLVLLVVQVAQPVRQPFDGLLRPAHDLPGGINLPVPAVPDQPLAPGVAVAHVVAMTPDQLLRVGVIRQGRSPS